MTTEHTTICPGCRRLSPAPAAAPVKKRQKMVHNAGTGLRSTPGACPVCERPWIEDEEA